MKAQGIDISHYQGTFTNLGNQDFIIARACNGTKEDTKFRLYVPEIKKTAIRGAYIYYRTNHIEHPPDEQAALFLKLSSGKGMQMLGVDYEVSKYDDNELTAETAIQLYGFMLFLAAQRPSKKILLYTSIYTWRDVLLPLQGFLSVFGEIDWFQFGIWLPRYGWPDDEHILNLEDGRVLPYYEIWQKSSKGKGEDYGVSSTFVDLNEFNGTLKQMLDWLKPEGEEPVKPIFESKTIWVGIIEIVIAIGGLIATFLEAGDYTAPAVTLLVVGVLKIVLRLFTSEGIAL